MTLPTFSAAHAHTCFSYLPHLVRRRAISCESIVRSHQFDYYLRHSLVAFERPHPQPKGNPNPPGGRINKQSWFTSAIKPVDEPWLGQGMNDLVGYAPSKDQIFMVYKGTTPTELKDWMSNVDMFPESVMDVVEELGMNKIPGLFADRAEEAK